MSILFALLGAFSNAAAAVFQHLANVTAPTGQLSWWRRVRSLIVNPVWLLGTAFLVATFVCGIVALYFGQLAVVQPLFVTELIFTLALRRWWLRDPIVGRTWAASALLCAGLTAFLVVAQPRNVDRPASPGGWAGVLTTGAVLTVALLVAARRGPPNRRAAAYGAAAAVVWSLDAAFVKAATEILRRHGWSGLPAHWPLYALIGTGIVGELLVQCALHVGPLSSSQPAMLIVEPVAGIAVGLVLFGERLAFAPVSVTVEAVSLLAMLTGVVLTERWAPPQMSPRPSSPPSTPPSTPPASPPASPSGPQGAGPRPVTRAATAGRAPRR